MIQIRPVSDLRNKFSEIEEIVTSTQSPVFLTKNGYGSMVVMSIQSYENITNNIEAKLDEVHNSLRAHDDWNDDYQALLSQERKYLYALNRIEQYETEERIAEFESKLNELDVVV